MNKLLIILLIISTFIFSFCKGKNVKDNQIGKKPNQNGKKPALKKIDIGIDVKVDVAKKVLIGKWKMIKPSAFYAKWKLGVPSILKFSEEDYLFTVTLKGKGKLMYKGKYQITGQKGVIFINFKRSHRAFEHDWKKAPAQEIAIVRFLDKQLKTAIINIVNPAWHMPEIDKKKNNLWTKISKEVKKLNGK